MTFFSLPRGFGMSTSSIPDRSGQDSHTINLPPLM